MVGYAEQTDIALFVPGGFQSCRHALRCQRATSGGQRRIGIDELLVQLPGKPPDQALYRLSQARQGMQRARSRSEISAIVNLPARRDRLGLIPGNRQDRFRTRGTKGRFNRSVQAAQA